MLPASQTIEMGPTDIAAVVRAFDALEPEQTLVVVTRANPGALLTALQADRPGAFDWNVLQSAPTYRVEVRRRADVGPRTVSECLGTDHRRLDAIFLEVDRLVRQGRMLEAAPLAAEFVCGLERHIEMEEQVLFPEFEAQTGIVGGPTEVMRQEHRMIRSDLHEIAEALAEQDEARFRAAADALLETLGSHNLKEERILYPMTDRSSGSPVARDELVRRMQRL
jgi:hemerythrin-like domain-containing protein/uncharacterized protein (DUF2249 family)